jgi:hypothetical protein
VFIHENISFGLEVIESKNKDMMVP